MRPAADGQAPRSDEPGRREDERSDDVLDTQANGGKTGEGSASDEPERREEERSDDEGAIKQGLIT